MSKGNISTWSEDSIHIIPFIITIFVTTFYLQLPNANQNTEMAFFHNPSRLIFLGFAYLLSLMSVVRKIQLSISIFSKNKIYLLLILFILSSILWSIHPFKVFINWGHYTGLTLVILSSLFYFGDKSEKIFLLISSYSFIAVTASLLLCFFFPERGIYSINGRWMGITTNPNSLGAICFVSIWANLACMGFYSQKTIRLFCTLTIMVTLVVLFGANSVTSIICSFFIFFSMIYYRIIHKNPPHVIILKLFLGMVFFIAVLLLVIAIQPDLLSFDAILSGAGRSKNLTGRVGLWETGFDLFFQKPWTGWSFDSLASVFEGSSIDAGQFHNGYIDLCIRGGFIGIGLVGFLIMKLLFNCLKILKNSSHVGVNFMILTFAILLHNLTEASLLRTTHLLWILFLLSYFYTSYFNRLSQIDMRGNNAV